MSSTKTYKVIVVGVGKRGTHHADAFAKNPRFELVGLADINAERLAAAAKPFGKVETSTDAAELLRRTRPDVFCFCTLPNVRAEMIRLAVEEGVRLIAYEKPVALSTNEALEIMKLTRQANGCHPSAEGYRQIADSVYCWLKGVL